MVKKVIRSFSRELDYFYGIIPPAAAGGPLHFGAAASVEEKEQVGGFGVWRDKDE